MSPGDEVRWLDADELAAWVNLIKLASRVVTLSDTELRRTRAITHRVNRLQAAGLVDKQTDQMDLRARRMTPVARRLGSTPGPWLHR